LPLCTNCSRFGGNQYSMSFYDNDKLRQLFMLAVIILLGGVVFFQLYSLFPGFLGAITLYVLLRPAMLYLTERQKWGPSLAATVLMLLSFLVFLVPVYLLVEMLSSKIGMAISNSNEFITGLQGITGTLKEKTGIDIFSAASLKKMQDGVAGILPDFLGATFSTITIIGILYFILYFMLVNIRRMEKSMYNYLPLKENNVDRLLLEVRSMVFSNAVGIPLIAVIQGVIALVGYFIFGVPNAMFWFVITCFMAMLPLVGSAIIWLPLATFLLINGQKWQGIGLIIYCGVLVSSADNIFRFMLQKKIGNVHPLVTILGVIVGVRLFGFIGLIFGPLLISMFILLLRIYHNEFSYRRLSTTETDAGNSAETSQEAVPTPVIDHQHQEIPPENPDKDAATNI
jgi:predicted PurR-regulated permease PerM